MKVVDIDFSNLSDIEYEDLFKTVVGTHEYVFFKDTKCRFTYLNEALLSSFNKTKLEDVIGKTDYDFYPKEFADTTFSDEQKIIKEKAIMLDKEEKLLQANGDITWYKASKYPLLNKNGDVIGVWGISSNISKQKNIEYQLEQANEKLLELKNSYQTKSEVDQTTGLRNKRKMCEDFKTNMYFFEKFKRDSDNFCIAFLDIDNFKQINDKHGHNIGDFVLKQVAVLFESAIRPQDSIYRFGGDEFIICYKGISLEQSKVATQRIIEIIHSHTFNIAQNEIKSSISAGVAACKEANTLNGVIDLADSRLYKAKDLGKNRVE